MLGFFLALHCFFMGSGFCQGSWTAPGGSAICAPGPIGLLARVSAWSFCSCEAVCLSQSWRCHRSYLWFQIIYIVDLGGVGVTHGKVEAGKLLFFFCHVYLDVVSAFPYASLCLVWARALYANWFCSVGRLWHGCSGWWGCGVFGGTPKIRMLGDTLLQRTTIFLTFLLLFFSSFFRQGCTIVSNNFPFYLQCLDIFKNCFYPKSGNLLNLFYSVV